MEPKESSTPPKRHEEEKCLRKRRKGKRQEGKRSESDISSTGELDSGEKLVTATASMEEKLRKDHSLLPSISGLVLDDPSNTTGKLEVEEYTEGPVIQPTADVKKESIEKFVNQPEARDVAMQPTPPKQHEEEKCTRKRRRGKRQVGKRSASEFNSIGEPVSMEEKLRNDHSLLPSISGLVLEDPSVQPTGKLEVEEYTEGAVIQPTADVEKEPTEQVVKQPVARDVAMQPTPPKRHEEEKCARKRRRGKRQVGKRSESEFCSIGKLDSDKEFSTAPVSMEEKLRKDHSPLPSISGLALDDPSVQPTVKLDVEEHTEGPIVQPTADVKKKNVEKFVKQPEARAVAMQPTEATKKQEISENARKYFKHLIKLQIASHKNRRTKGAVKKHLECRHVTCHQPIPGPSRERRGQRPLELANPSVQPTVKLEKEEHTEGPVIQPTAEVKKEPIEPFVNEREARNFAMQPVEAPVKQLIAEDAKTYFKQLISQQIFGKKNKRMEGAEKKHPEGRPVTSHQPIPGPCREGSGQLPLVLVDPSVQPTVKLEKEEHTEGPVIQPTAEVKKEPIEQFVNQPETGNVAMQPVEAPVKQQIAENAKKNLKKLIDQQIVAQKNKRMEGAVKNHPEGRPVTSHQPIPGPSREGKKQLPLFMVSNYKEGGWIAAVFNDVWYPGKVEKINEDGTIRVNFLSRCGEKRLFVWPRNPDRRAMLREDLLYVLDKPPVQVKPGFYRVEEYSHIEWLSKPLDYGNLPF